MENNVKGELAEILGNPTFKERGNMSAMVERQGKYSSVHSKVKK
jgi:hypothetical protein